MCNSLSFFTGLRFNEQGLVAAISQEAATGHVLFQVFVNREALAACLETGWLHYYHQGMRKVWKKGESSGHRQRIRSIRLACDGGSVLFLVEPLGGACEEGYQSCFYREWQGAEWIVTDSKVFDPELVYPEFTMAH